MNIRLNPNLEAQLEAIAEAHWHPATARPVVNIPTTTSTEARMIRQASEPWQRHLEAMERRPAQRAPARRAWLLAGFALCTAIVAIWIVRGQ